MFKVTYLIDEAVETGKGVNTVVSLLHHYLEKYSLKELDLHFFADNCSGNRFNENFNLLNKAHYVVCYK